jgi:hypothetical protein
MRLTSISVPDGFRRFDFSMATPKTEPVDLGFLEKVRKAQYDLHCEIAMNTIEVRLREHRVRDTLAPGFLQFCNSEKRHFLTAYLFSSYLRTGRFPAWHTSFRQQGSSINPDDISHQEHHDYRSFKKSFKDAKLPPDSPFTELFVALLPARYHFFLSDDNCRLFATHLVDLSASAPSPVGRALFLTPGFLSFSAVVFRPLLSPLAASPAPDVSSLGADIAFRWQRAMDRFPPGVLAVLKSPKLALAALLSACFFELALAPGRARLYGLVEYWLDLSEPLCAALRSLLTVAGSVSILGELAAAIAAAPAPTPGLIAKADVGKLQTLFTPYLGSTLDSAVYDALTRRPPVLPDVPTYEAVCVWTGGIQADSVRDPAETLRPGHPAAALRHMLQRADPIPRFFAIPDELTVGDFFRQYVVEGGPRATRFQRERDCEFALSRLHTKSDIINSLASTKLDRAEELMKLSMFTRIERAYRRAGDAGAEGRAVVQRCLAWIALRAGVTRAPKTPEVYAATPSACADDVKVLKQMLPKGGGAFDAEIAYASVTARVTFFAFKELSPALAEYDAAAAAELAEAQAARVIGYCQRRDGAAAKWLHQAVTDISAEGVVIAQLQGVTRDLHPLRMLQEFAAARAMVKERLEIRARGGAIVGHDDIGDALSATLILANPQGIASAFVFLHDFLSPSSYGADILPGLYHAIVPVIAELLAGVLRIDPVTLCRLPASP